MKIVVGLGNPGPRYETSRHNSGFLAADRLIDAWGATGPQHKHDGEIYQATVGDEKVLIVKPQDFYNNTGKSVAPLFRLHKCEPSDVIAIHDELDLPPLQLRIKTGGGAGGNNGIRSMDQHLGGLATGYHRIRIGIGHPSRTPGLEQMSPADYVLQQYKDEELSKLDPLLDRVVKACEMMIRGEISAAMNEFNRS